MNSILLFDTPGGLGLSVLFLVLIAPCIFWLWALVDCLRSEFENNNKLIWILLIVLVPFLGAILYLTIGRGQRIKI